MKSILAPIVFAENAEATLAAACAVAAPFGGDVESYYAYPMRAVMVSDAMGIAASITGDLDEGWRVSEQHARAAFDRFVSENGIPPGDGATVGTRLTARWIAQEGSRSVAIGEYGRLADLIVLTRNEAEPNIVLIVCEEALFESGRPILLTPNRTPEQMGTRILIAWNGGTETARTIAFGLPMLERAESVRVLTVVGATVRGPTAEQVAEHLRRRGIPAEAETIEPGKWSAGEAILRHAEFWKADLLFKGAYTHSRLRQMIFGGPTRHIVSEATIPVLMAH